MKRMAAFCYVVGDEKTRTCGLIDPAFETGRILSQVGDLGYKVTHIINTHGHADHTAGNRTVRAATGAKLLIHEQDAPLLERPLNRVLSRLLGGKGSPRPDILLKDRDAIGIGFTTLTVLHTPGHTPGGICLYTRGHLFTGDTLFVGGVGRTDLRGGSPDLLLRSIREKIYTLPGGTRVWPGHDYGRACSSTVEYERRTNPFARG